MILRNSRCLLQWYVSPSKVTARHACRQLPTVVNRGGAGAAPGSSQRSSTTAGGLATNGNCCDHGSRQSGFP